ncbi:MAG TPA: DUF1828 domain-containing protein [Amaricoccus sp.]|uniref:DUF1828 domain-containing protein n=1 Tax=Amaricoccus sp. TaxID=1872485 RepID=UPI002BDB6DEA|nr:DUF1828 domain-containing protein [Amaricoccus sp.]HMQ95199.1 DUF1828 domain-containing protein [Amaricoccus sp.]HMR52504.1 DUF1828 domain-containing protein [Amaricoccus sp.]HMR59841.1 DUF1828 domain-containing protein [Amaricoccus sp.]HMT99425.1 DUF1828 domain-containing protein [Amaricoccus sp.]
MIDAESLRNNLCKTFCSSIVVNPVASGFAVSTLFSDRSGDPIGFYVVDSGDGFRIEDDGEYLARLIGSGIPIDQGNRAQLLEAILQQGGASWDHDTYEIRTESFAESKLGLRLTSFLSALIRVRDLELLTREVVRSTFREDATAALQQRYGHVAKFSENESFDRTLSEFPADLIIRPNHDSAKSGALYFVNSNEKLSEALLLQMESNRLKRDDLRIIALIEDSEMRTLSKKKFQRAQNRSLSMPIFRGDEDAAVERIGRDLEIAA